MNRGLAIAKGEYIARMDADDISLPERFASQVAYLDAHSNIAVLGSNLQCFNETGVICTGWSVSEPRQMKVDMLFSCGLAHPSVMMRTCVIRDLGGYDPDFNGMEDYELWCRVLESCEITTLPDVLLRYRIHGDQVTQNPSPRHRERMRQLKCRQLETLGIKAEVAEPFFRFCEEGKPDTADEIKALDAFFALAETANRERRLYDEQTLCTTFRSVISSAAVRLPRSEQKKIISGCRFLKNHQLIALTVRQKIKDLLGRK